MKPIMNINDLNTIEQMEQFLTGSQSVAFLVASSKDECYLGIQRTLVKFRYASLNKRSKGVVVRFLIKITGYSRQQITRLVKQYRDTGKIERQQRTYQGFERVYTNEDIRLMAALDERHNTLSGPATKKLCERLIPFSNKHNTNGWRAYRLRICTTLENHSLIFGNVTPLKKPVPKSRLLAKGKNREPMASLVLFGLIRFIKAIRISKKASTTLMPLMR